MKFQFYAQLDAMDCGPTCLRMVAKYYKKAYSGVYLRKGCFITREGVTLLGISEAAEKIGFRTFAAKLTFEQLTQDAALPCILHWNQNHFIVLPPQNHRDAKSNKFLIADPAHGLIKVDKETFLKAWISTSDSKGVALLLEPTPLFYETGEPGGKESGLKFLFSYVKPYKKYFIQLCFGLFISSLLSLIFPFLTQSLVDYGVNHQNINFIRLILLSQMILFLGTTAIEIIRSWLLLHINSRINLSILSDFLMKLMNLPMSFFDSKMHGDITQRMQDHTRIENFLTKSSLSTLFSSMTLIVFSIVLGIYSPTILLTFLGGSILTITWVLFFLRKRKAIDYKRFQQMGNNQNNVYELISGMQEIKLNNCETIKRWNWEKVQVKLFKLNIKGLALEQYQQTGGMFFSQLKNIIISYLSAVEVVNGTMSLGMMLSVSYIVGQMNSPMEQLIGFFRSAQDAMISLERLKEIHDHDNEEKDEALLHGDLEYGEEGNEDIVLENVSFQYSGPRSPYVLKDVSLQIPKGKITAIVGTSGSGKTTLLKLLLQFYSPVNGKIKIGNMNLANISPKRWRKKCGTVMQDSFIFSDTIANNIALEEDAIDEKSLFNAVRIGNIESFIKKLPLGFLTNIGNTGNGISAGQKQRILIARSVYKNPEYLFLDEATSALDANNEKVIMENLDQFFKGKTVVIIAHRLSTVKNADQIVVLEDGQISEVGNHTVLSARRGKYFELVKNQLELGQ